MNLGQNSKRVMPIVLCAALLIAGNAWAQARKTGISCTADAVGNVTVNFRIKGVGNGDLCVVSSETFTADCACKNNGGTCPRAANKQATDVPTSTGQSFSSTNGQISGTEVITAPGSSTCNNISGFSCPGGQTAILAELDTQPVTVQVFAPGTFTTDGTCSPNANAIPVYSKTCTPSPEAVVFDRKCAALF